MKRKALLTSTALLLVALICLATASYAWFTQAGTNKVEIFEIGVEAGDGGLQLAPAQANNNYAAGVYRGSLVKSDWGTGWAKFPTSLIAVSTDGANDFYSATYDVSSSEWTCANAAGTEYVLFSFWVKAPSAGTATLSINYDTTAAGASTFASAVKVGYNLAAASTPGNFTIFDLAVDANDSYQPVIAAGAISYKTDAGSFEPTTATGNAAKFGSQRTQTALASQTLTFSGTNPDPQLVTIAVWLEGMDDNCTGSFNLTGQSITISGSFVANS